MRKNKYLYILFVLFMYTLLGCSGNKQPEGKLIKRLIETTANGQKKTILFSYDGYKIKSIEDVDKKTDFTYKEELIVKKVVLDKAGNTSLITNYRYENDKLVEAKSNTKIIRYVHNPDSTVVYEKFDLDSNLKEIKTSHGTLFYTNGNLVKEESVLDTGLVSIIDSDIYEFKYDDKINPFASIIGYAKLLDIKEQAAVNTVVITTVFKSRKVGDQEISSAKFYKNTYKYDNTNCPTEQNTEEVRPSSGKLGSLKMAYFYN